jgi:conjugal transfer pilus assembly protein TraV
MKKITLSFSVFTALLALQGCMTPIGKEEFSCPNQKKGGVCAGPRDIYELTNTRENLEDLSTDSEYDGYVITTNEDGETVAVKRDGNKKPSSQSPSERVRKESDPSPHVYESREHSQNSKENFQPAKVKDVRPTEQHQDDSFAAWPRAPEPLAPEPLAVIEPPKVMRVLLASYKDAKGNLNMPGYVYVQVEAETWSIGEAANILPQRVVPSKVREKANQELKNNQIRQSGVSPIETTTGVPRLQQPKQPVAPVTAPVQQPQQLKSGG